MPVFVAVNAGSATAVSDTDTKYQTDELQATPDDVFVITLRNGAQFKIVGYDDDVGGGTGYEDFMVGRPVGVDDYVNFYGYDFESGGSFQITEMDGTPLYTVTNGGAFSEGYFRITVTGNTMTVQQDTGDDTGTVNPNGTFSGTFDQISTLFSGAFCFLGGTKIATPAGERAIETLQIGDLITTASGVQKCVKWAARMTVPVTRFNRAKVLPVCIKQGALGNGLPHSDLFVSHDHGIAIDGVLVIAGVLVNGTTIVRCDDFAADVVEYFHVEVEDHDLLLAEGAAAETFSGSNRERFDNAAEFHALYPDAVQGKLMAMGRVTQARQLPKALRSKFFVKVA